MDQKDQETTADPRLAGVDETFLKIIAGIGSAFGGLAQSKGARATHTLGTTARGRLTVLSRPDIPRHRYFKSGTSYPVLVRHANIKGLPDDAIRDGRGLTLRVLKGDADAATADLDLHDHLVDVLSSTGPCFFLNNAAVFAQWVAGSMEQRAEMVKAFPKITPIFHQIVKNPDSYTQLHYYSETTYHFLARNGSAWYLRYRIVNADQSADTGHVPLEDLLLPQDYIPRPDCDTRSETYLQDDFKERVTAASGVYYLLQMQLRPVSVDPAANEEAKDCTIAWDEEKYRMRDVAIIHLNEIVANETVEPLEFSPYHAPPELGLILGQTATDTASINHLRSVVYTFSAKMRKGEPLPPGLAGLVS